jgi:hypothetical protein
MLQHNVQRPVPDRAPDQRDYLTGIGDQVADVLETRQNAATHPWSQNPGGT